MASEQLDEQRPVRRAQNDLLLGPAVERLGPVVGEVVLDVMPIDDAIYGFTNPWFREAYHTADRTHGVRIATPQMLLATKLAAGQGRGNDDLLASKDVRDCFTLMDGRPQIAGDVKRASPNGCSLADEAADRLRDRIEAILGND